MRPPLPPLRILVALLAAAAGCGDSAGGDASSDAFDGVDGAADGPTPDADALDGTDAPGESPLEADDAVVETWPETDVAIDAGPDVPARPCPSGMALVEDAFCVDLHEGALEERAPDGSWAPASPYLTVGTRTVRAVPAAGIPPQGYISGTEAAAACAASGKRLCTSEEWLAACRGPDELLYPYGAEHVAGACNDHYAGGHPVVDFFGTAEGVWDLAHMNDPGINQQPGTVAPGGVFAACVSAWGVFDLHGNLHEWVADVDGTFRGGFYADASINGPGCTYRTGAHDAGYHDYSTGFRCCADRAR